MIKSPPKNEKSQPKSEKVKKDEKLSSPEPGDEQSPDKMNGEEGLDKKGIWEVIYESGAVIGYFEGTPKRIAEFVVSTDPEGRFIRKLRFVSLPVRRIPEKIMKEVCCEKKFSRKDNFCSRCGKSLNMEAKLPAKIKLIVES